LFKPIFRTAENELKLWGNFSESSDRVAELRPWILESWSSTLFFYSKAQRPDPHSGRPQPKLGVLGLSHIGKEFERPEWAEAGTLNCLATSTLPHLGQRATSLGPRTKVSKIWSQGSQWYS
jgi:hypothetical protein